MATVQARCSVLQRYCLALRLARLVLVLLLAARYFFAIDYFHRPDEMRLLSHPASHLVKILFVFGSLAVLTL